MLIVVSNCFRKGKQMKVGLTSVDDIFNEAKGKDGSLIPVLQKIQEINGYLSEEIIERIASELKLTIAEVYGVATFYTQFRLTPVGKYIIKICHGTACHVGGANSIDDSLKSKLGISIGETTNDGLFTILSVACLGCCSLAPVIMINDKTYGKLTNERLGKVLDKYIDAEKQGITL